MNPTAAKMPHRVPASRDPALTAGWQTPQADQVQFFDIQPQGRPQLLQPWATVVSLATVSDSLPACSSRAISSAPIASQAGRLDRGTSGRITTPPGAATRPRVTRPLPQADGTR